MAGHRSRSTQVISSAALVVITGRPVKDLVQLVRNLHGQGSSGLDATMSGPGAFRTHRPPLPPLGQQLGQHLREQAWLSLWPIARRSVVSRIVKW